MESVDQPIEKRLDSSAKVTAQRTPHLLGGVILLRGKFADGTRFQAIPNNRCGGSIVWVRE